MTAPLESTTTNAVAAASSSSGGGGGGRKACSNRMGSDTVAQDGSAPSYIRAQLPRPGAVAAASASSSSSAADAHVDTLEVAVKLVVNAEYGELEVENLRALNQHPEARRYTVPLVLAQLLHPQSLQQQQGDPTLGSTASLTTPLWLIITEYMPHTGLAEDIAEKGPVQPTAVNVQLRQTFVRRCRQLLQVRGACVAVALPVSPAGGSHCVLCCG